MHLLTEIIELLSANAPDLENALFKAQVLAHRLGEADMKEWVAHELKGYPDREALPPYRVLPVTVMANLSNGVVRYSDHPLPMMGVDERLRDKLETRRVSESIAVIANWAKRESNLAIVIAPEYFGHLKKGIDRSFEIERAWGKHSVGAMLQVVTEVRSRLLELALQVSDRIPQEPKPDNIKQLAQEVAVSEIFRNAVFGSNTTIVVGSGSIQGTTNSVVANNLSSLMSALRTQGVQDPDLEDLRLAVDADKHSDDVNDKKIGPSVRKWIAGMVSKAASGAWEMGIATAGGVLAAAIGAYYGIGAA
jgi:AbiTii